MGLLPLDFYSLTQAVDFINQKTNSTIKENLLYSYAMEGKIRFLLNIEIKDNQLVKIGRMDTEGFFLYEGSEVYFKEDVIEYEVQNILHLEDKLSKMEITSDEIFVDKGGLFLSYNKENKINEYKGYIVLHPELLDVFCKESLPQHSLRNTNYLILDEFNVQNPLEADIFNLFNFTMKYPKYNEDEQLYMKHTFRINFSDIKISYDDLIKLTPSGHPLRCDDLETKIEKLTKEIEEKQKTIDSLSLTSQNGRISSPQKQLFALLVKKCYPKLDSRNKLFDVINADLKESGIRNTNIAADTFYRLIDESNDIIKAIFPPKKS
jgi:hypothetical protein